MKSHYNREEKRILSESEVHLLSQQAEEARLREAIARSDTEKFKLLTKMLKRNAMFNRAIITHKK